MNDKGAGFEYESIPVGYYDNVFRQRKGIQSRWHHEKFVRISAEVGPGRLLDIGCGPGTFIGTLDSSINATGIDISSRQIDYARSNNRSADREFKLVGKAPLRPGPVHLFRDGVYMGAGSRPLLAPGETHKLGFGADDRIRISRTESRRETGEAGLLTTELVKE